MSIFYINHNMGEANLKVLISSLSTNRSTFILKKNWLVLDSMAIFKFSNLELNLNLKVIPVALLYGKNVFLFNNKFFNLLNTNINDFDQHSIFKNINCNDFQSTLKYIKSNHRFIETFNLIKKRY